MDFLLRTKFESFNTIKSFLLSHIEKAYSKEQNETPITRLDWDEGRDMNRPWVKYIAPLLHYNLTKLIRTRHPSFLEIDKIWYQQYHENSYHDWHVHSHHYTGVFYLEFPKGSPKTELFIDNKIISVEAEEGDLIIFPSSVIHRAAKNTTPQRKTIISYNMDLTPDFDYLPI